MIPYAVHSPIPEDVSKELAHLNELIAKLLFLRGITSKQEAEAFLNPSYERHLHDPFLLKGMDLAVEKIFASINLGHPVVIFTDYDHDGVPAGVILSDYFDKIGYTNYRVYIPHRHHEGFGLNKKAIDEFIAAGCKLLITADCGIADVEEVKYAEQNGISVIITDHHEVTHGIPPAYAVIDPKQDGCVYPEKNLCGAGVAFKLVQGMLSKDRRGVKEGWEKWLLDMVAIATLSDMVPLRGENRALAHYGLMVLRKSPRLGIRRLLRKLRINQLTLTEEDVGFGISPRINAASRMGVPYDAFRLLKTTNEKEADELVAHLEAINQERKTYVAVISKKAKKMIAEKYQQSPKVVVIGDPEWKPSLLGLVANKITEEYQCPAFVWGREGSNLFKGSCRSYNNIDLQMILGQISKDIVPEYGGHSLAGGFSVSQDGIHDFQGAVEQVIDSVIQGSTAKEKKIDHALQIADVNQHFFRHLRSLSPFGEGNPNPVFLFPDAELVSIRNFGKGHEHVELLVSQNGRTIKAIQFFADKKFTALAKGHVLNLVAHIEADLFSGGALRLRIKDFF